MTTVGRKVASRTVPVVALAGLAAMLALDGPATAQLSPRYEATAEQGLAIAERMCSNCHLVEKSGVPTAATPAVPAGIPTFRAIANRNGQTGRKILDTLILPHAPMPNLQLSTNEAADILAYLETLRTNPSVPPLLDPGSLKPKLPSPS